MNRVSVYDPFRDEIETWCNAGMPVKEIANRLGPGYSMQGVYAFIRSRKLRRSKEIVINARHKCSECEYCHDFKTVNNTDGRICAKSWKAIQPLVRYCPGWCEREKAYENI